MSTISKLFERFDRWLGRTDIECDDPLAVALPPYDTKPWPVCTPRIGETYARYARRARESRERALLYDVWKVTAEPDGDGVWKTVHDEISRERDRILERGIWPA